MFAIQLRHDKYLTIARFVRAGFPSAAFSSRRWNKASSPDQLRDGAQMQIAQF
jgi:hypothetical protein